MNKLILHILINILEGMVLLVKYYNNIPQDLKDGYKKYSDKTIEIINKNIEKF